MARILMFAMMILGVDVGGTFTDLILIDTMSGKQYVHKISSTPESQDIAVIEGINEILQKNNLAPQAISQIIHGTTVATNAMLERKGARVVLLTTEGFEDVLEIGRQNREEIYDLYARKPHPFVRRENRIGVHERLDSTGVPIVELTSLEVDKTISQAGFRQPEAIAISLLFSFRNANHERRLLHELKGRNNCYVVASSDVLPEFREYERVSTTVLEAYLGPVVLGYLARLGASLKTINPQIKFTVMQSNGGTMLASSAYGNATNLAISGLAGGVIGGWQIARQNNVHKAITLDMGGTSCDISAIIEDIMVKPDNEVAGLPLRMPSVDVKTIGAGGGSIAWLDKARILHVGPQSAGAVPGPAAYDKDGLKATVTDANLLLGRLDPEYFLGGSVKLNLEKAREAVSRIAKGLDTTIEEAALGISRISTANMVQAIREVTVNRGADPRQFVLIPFGGAGPTQGTDIGEALAIENIIVPPYPGITSALGLVCTDLRVDLMRTILVKANRSNLSILQKALASLTNSAKERLVEQGAREADIGVSWSIDMRYQGQSHEVSVPFRQTKSDLLVESVKEFESIHKDSFGYIMKERNIEWVTARVTSKAHSWQYTPQEHECIENRHPKNSRQIILHDRERVDADIYRRKELAIGQRIMGPAIVEQLDTTIYVGPEWEAVQMSNGTLSMRRNTE